MKNFFRSILTLCLTSALVLMGQVYADATVQFGVGYRSDDVKSKITLPDSVRLNSYSSLRFKDLEMCTINARVKSTCGDCLYYRADFQYGWILDGDAKEKDQFSLPNTCQNTQTCNFSPAFKNRVKGRNTADFSLALGYPLEHCFAEGLQLVPTIGFAYDTQRIRYKNHNTVPAADLDALDFTPCDVTSSSGSSATVPGDSSTSSSSLSLSTLNNTFRSTWWGPFVGVDFTYNCHDCWNLYGEIQFHWTRTRRERGTHLDFCYLDRYRESRNGWGYNMKIGSIYHINCNWYLDGHFNYSRFTSDHRNDNLRWFSYGLGLDIGYLF